MPKRDGHFKWKTTSIKKSSMAMTKSLVTGLMASLKVKPKSSTIMATTSSIFYSIKEASSKKDTKCKALWCLKIKAHTRAAFTTNNFMVEEFSASRTRQ